MPIRMTASRTGPDGEPLGTPLEGILLTDDEWHRLTDPLNLDRGRLTGPALNEVFQVLVGRIDASYNVAHMVRELINAGHGSQSVPPKDLPEQVKRLGEARRAAEHHARTLAGEVADLTSRIEDRLPAVFGDTLAVIAADLEGRMADLSHHEIVDAGEMALLLALRLTADYDMRDREPARPRAITCLDCDQPIDMDRLLLGQLVHRDPRPADVADHPARIDTPPRPSSFVTMSWSAPPLIHTAGGAGGSGGGSQATGGHASGGFASTAQSEHPAPTVHNVYGVPISDAHPAVVYLAELLGPLKGCDGTLHCRRATVARALLDAAEDLGDAKESLSGEPLDRFTRRCAERLADLPVATYSLQTLTDLCRDAWEHSARIILRRPDAATRNVNGSPCPICDGRGTVHRLGCPNG